MEHKQVINFGAGPAKLPQSVSIELFAFAGAVSAESPSDEEIAER